METCLLRELFLFGPALEELPDISSSDVEAFEGYISNSSDKHLRTTVTSSQMEVISVVEYAATSTGSTHNLPECSALLEALEKTVASFKDLKAVSIVLKVACIQVVEFRSSWDIKNSADSCHGKMARSESSQRLNRSETSLRWHKCVEASVELFTTYLSTDDAKSLVLHCSTCVDCLFNLFWEEDLRSSMFGYILDLMKTAPTSEEDHKAKLHLCSKYLETFNQVKERERNFTDISLDLLAGMREILVLDQAYYQSLFRNGECFLHVVSLLNGTHDTFYGEKLVLSVLETLMSLLAHSDASKAAFRSLVGRGYQSLQSLLLDHCRGYPTEQLLNARLDMLVDAEFDLKANPLIENEDAIIL